MLSLNQRGFNSISSDTPVSPEHGDCGPNIGRRNSGKPFYINGLRRYAVLICAPNRPRKTSTPVSLPARFLDQAQEQIR